MENKMENRYAKGDLRYAYLDKETFESSLFRMGLEASYHSLTRYSRTKRDGELNSGVPLPSDITRECINEVNNFTRHYKEKGELDGTKYQELYKCINETYDSYYERNKPKKQDSFYNKLLCALNL